MGWMKDETGLGRSAANYMPLTPLSGLQRAARIYRDELAVVYGAHRKTYGEYHDRVTRLASALVAIGVKPGEVVATLIPNLPAQAEAHFGVPACGAVLRLTAWPTGTPCVERPDFTATTGLDSETRRAIRENLRGLPMDSR